MAVILPRLDYVPAPVPTAAMGVTIALSAISIIVLITCLYRRVSSLANYEKIPLARWLIIFIYVDSLTFVLSSTILGHGWGFSTSPVNCSVAILLCLICYMTTKLIYYFMVERVYIIRCVRKPRMKSRLYLFNCFGMLVPYVVVIIMTFINRITRIDEGGHCIVGVETNSIVPLVTFDVAVNVWLTCLFLVPLRKMYSYQKGNPIFRNVALRTFIGAILTLLSVVANLSALIILNGEEGWVCIMACNLEILFSVLVLHWVTTNDSKSSEHRSGGTEITKGQAGISSITSTAKGARLHDSSVSDSRITYSASDCKSEEGVTIELPHLPKASNGSTGECEPKATPSKLDTSILGSIGSWEKAVTRTKRNEIPEDLELQKPKSQI